MKHPHRQATRPAVRLTPLAAFLTTLGLAFTGSALAADAKSLPELEAEVARLKAAYEQAQQALAAVAPANGSTRQTASSDGKKSVELDTIVINSKRSSPLAKLKDTPKSVSVVSGEELDKLGAVNVDDIFKRVGNVKWNYGNPKTGSMSIRGISSGSSENIDPSLGVSVDNVPYAYVALASGSDYIDLESVDVARGPQGFDGGRATTMGTINIKTRRPTFVNEANASITYGQYQASGQRNSLLTQGAVGGPVVDGLLAWRGSFYRNQQEGAWGNAYFDTQDRVTYGNSDRTYGRVQFLLTPSTDFEALLSLDYKPKGIEFVNGLTVRNAYPTPYYSNGTNYDDVAKNGVATKLARRYFTAAGAYTYQNYLNDVVNEDNNKGILNGTKGGSANLTWQLPGHTLTSTTAYRDNFFQAGNDEGTAFDVTKNSGLYVHYQQVSQELKLASKPAPGKEVDYLTGFYYGHTQSDAASRTRYGADAGAWFATQAQYLLLDPLTANANSASGNFLLRDSINNLRKQTLTLTDNTTQAVYGKLDWHLDNLTGQPLTLGAGLRLTHENRQTRQGNQVTDEGWGGLLNAGNQGGFNSNASSGALLTTNSASQIGLANQLAQRYFGVSTYAALTAAQQQQVAAAKSIRSAQRGSTSEIRAATPYADWLPTGFLSLSYKVNDGLTYYGTYQHGAKPGISQVVSTTNAAANVKSETTDAFELGFRSAALNNTLIFNADVYYQKLKDFQTSINVYDAVQAQATPANPYLSLTGNLPEVTIKGLEVDATYTGLERFTFRFAGAYNDARYSKSVLLAGPEEDGYLAANVFDAKGKTLPNASKITYNLSGSYRQPTVSGHEFHVDANWNWRSRYNYSSTLSQYSWVEPYGVLDLGLGVGRKDKSYDFTFLIKNALGREYPTQPTATSYVPSAPRWLGLMFSAKL